MRNRDTIEFLGIWEHLNNPGFKHIEFDVFKSKAGSNSFSLTPKRWIESVNAVGLINKSGRYGGGTYAHKDIAFEFASWISAEFKLYIIKEFQRLKEDEGKKLALGWDVKRILTKINYKIHTDAIKKHLIPENISKSRTNIVYANEADVLNVALFGKTAMEWRDENSGKELAIAYRSIAKSVNSVDTYLNSLSVKSDEDQMSGNDLTKEDREFISRILRKSPVKLPKDIFSYTEDENE